MSEKRKLERKESQAILTDDQVSELKLAFDMFDEHQNGYLTKQDVKDLLDKYGDNSKQLDEMFREADVTGSGKIGFPEFVSMMARKMKLSDTEDELLEAFKVFDPYNEGFIPIKELSDSLLNTGDKLTKEELDEMLRVCSIDGQVNYKTFINLMYARK